ncbi:MAG: cysteine desulfurase IscS [Gemmatimonadota bacterium]|nr:MAG: cysteine desulfurase IscS [Gemmatimonadota bacterium]
MRSRRDRPIYMDAHATTPLDPRVLAAMLPFFGEEFGNAASRNHEYGRRAEAAVDRARGQVAAAIGASPKEIVWTSGATESDNLAVLGVARAHRERGQHVVTCVTEHPAVLDPLLQLEREGWEVTRLRVSPDGHLDPEELRLALTAQTTLVSIMAANNEVGTLHPIRELARIVHEHSPALFHTDAVQALGWIPLDVQEDGIDLLSISGHKIYGPKGVGALFVRRRRPTVRLAPQQFGGGHERGLRSGTLNVPGIVGLGVAAELAAQGQADVAPRIGALRDSLLAMLERELDQVLLNGDATRRLPNNLNVSFVGVDAEDLLNEIPGVAVSTGAACSSASLDPSHVITALGLGEARAASSIRFGLTRLQTREEVDRVAAEVVAGVRALRNADGIRSEC